MTIVAGGSVTNTFGLLGWESVDEAEVEIDGGTWDNTGQLTVGSGGKALLTVKGAGLLKSNTAIIADDATSIATVIVDGAGSKWQNTGTLAVGDTNGSGTQGSLILRNGGEVSSTGNIGIVGKGYAGGVGKIAGNLSNTTTLDPGYYDAVANDTIQGTLNITGNYTQFGSAKLQIALAATGHDKLDIDGMISLLSTTNLEISFDAGFNPSAGQSWDILDWGTASSNFVNRFNASLPALDSNESWDLSQLYTDGIIKVVGTGSLPGDFSTDGVVDARDYIVLRNNSSSTASDYNTWRANFGRSSGAGALGGMEAVPEPGSLALGLMALVGAAVQCRRHGIGRNPSAVGVASCR
jgi:T5SS/PEP-CTERM-associated repeat protein